MSGGIDEVGGYMAAYFSWLLGICTILMGIVAYGQPNKDDTRFTVLIGAWALYSILTSLRFRWASKAARHLALRSPSALEALVQGDVVEIRYETH